MGVTVILPTLNERENIRKLVPGLLAEVESVEQILVVDDGSTDGTQQLALELGESDPRVQLIARTGRPCLTDALQEGIDAATAERVAWMDADGAMSPADLNRLIAELDAGARVAVGSRFAPGGKIKGQSRDGFLGRFEAMTALTNTEDSVLGAILSWGLNGLFLPLVIGDGIHDYTSGFIVLDKAALDGIRLRGDHGEYFIDMWVRLRKRGITIHELPYEIQARVYGESKTGTNTRDFVRRGWRYLTTALGARFG